MNWSDAGKWVSGLKSGVCGLTDGSVEGKWRVPTRNELTALINDTEAVSYKSPALFSNVQSDYYWSADAYSGAAPDAWNAYLFSGGVFGGVFGGGKTDTVCVWPVR